MIWYLYLNDVFAGVTSITVLAVVCYMIFLVFLPMWADIADMDAKEILKTKVFKLVTIAVLVSTVISVLLPSRVTLYSLAANEVIKEVKDTPEVKALREFIVNELNKAKSESSAK